MTTWTVVLLLWIAPALVLLAALLRANLRKSARRRPENDGASGKTPKAESASAD